MTWKFHTNRTNNMNRKAIDKFTRLKILVLFKTLKTISFSMVEYKINNLK